MFSKKICKIFLIILIFMFFCANDVNADIPQKTICNIGTTDGLLYPNEWVFKITYLCNTPTAKITSSNGKYKCSTGVGNYHWEVSYGKVKICPITGCNDNAYNLPISKGTNLSNLFKSSFYHNVYASSNQGIDGVYTDNSLISLLESGKCPNYIYIGSNGTTKKIGYIYSSKKLDNAKELLENAGFVVEFTQDGGENLTIVSETNYKNQVKKMQDNINEFKNGGWGNTYNASCSSLSKFGGITWGDNLVIEYYNKYKEELMQANPNYDFSSGEKVLVEYKAMDCAPEPQADQKVNSGKVTCETIFKDSSGNYNNTHKLLSGALRFMQYLGIILAVILSIVDFVKVIPGNDKDGIQKASKAAVTRLIIAIVIFFVPIILNFILSLVGFNDPTCGLL